MKVRINKSDETFLHALIMTDISRRRGFIAVASMRTKGKSSSIAAEIASQISGKLVEAEKFAAKGMIATEIAQEINGSLANLRTSFYIVENMRLDSDGHREKIREISREIARMSSIVKALLDVYGPNENFMQPVDVNSEIEKVLDIVKRKLCGSGISVFTELGPGIPPLLCYEGHLKKMLLGLVRHSEQAMEKTAIKELYIITRNPGRQISICIEDTGAAERCHGLEMDICVQLAHKYSGSVRFRMNGKTGRQSAELQLPF